MLPFFAWWLIIEVLGLAALPLTRRVFAWLPDRGYAFSKAVGLLLVSYLLWWGAMTGLLTNDLGGIFLALLLVAGLAAWTGLRGGDWRTRLAETWRAEKARILAVEVLFLIAFAGWTLLRAYAPDKILPSGGEKYMEIAFLNGVLNSPRFPPLDPWLANYAISYYYFGYVMMAVMTRLTGVIPTVGFDLYDALVFALTAAGAYGVVANLVELSAGSRRAARSAGVLAALFVTTLGNLEGLVHGLYSAGWLPQRWVTWLGIPGLDQIQPTGHFYPGSGWWWWTASRVLNDVDLSGKSIPIQPIDEFPFFSFLLGDNHPHKLALPFVLLAIGLALNLLVWRCTIPGRRPAATPGDSAAEGSAAPEDGKAPPTRRQESAWMAEAGRLVFYALALGALIFLNTWDFPIYLGLVLLADAAGRILAGAALDRRLLGQMAGLGAGLGAGALLFYFFFLTGFSSQAGGVLPYVFPPTRLPQYLVMFGPFVVILSGFLITAARRSDGGFAWRKTLGCWAWVAGLGIAFFLLIVSGSAAAVSLLPVDGPAASTIRGFLGDMGLLEAINAILYARAANPWLFLLLSALLALALASLFYQRDVAAWQSADTPSTTFALLLVMTGLALTFIVEFFYLRDNFGTRMNTIFKFYYQGWVMLACASAYALWWTLHTLRGLMRTVFQIACGLVIAAGLVYPVMAYYGRADGFSQEPNLDAAASFAGVYPGHWAAHPDDWAAAQWLRQAVKDHPSAGIPAEIGASVPILLEAPGGGYENNGRISAFTGFPTLLGWTNHEEQWRGSREEINAREPEIRTIFTTPTAGQALDLLQKWGVRYVIVGDAERQYVERMCADANAPCDSVQALEKFNQVLTPVFSQGSITIYQVPDRLSS